MPSTASLYGKSRSAPGRDTCARSEAARPNWRDDWWLNGENAFFTGSANRLDEFVEDDIVWMRVEALGSLSYETQIGGETTAPVFEVQGIKRQKGSC